MSAGCEWLVEAYGCAPASLSDVEVLRGLFAEIIEGLGLHPVEEPLWRRFPGAGGVTGLVLLAESHLACHTFPEYRSLCLNLFCCRPRPEWDFASALSRIAGAERVSVRRIERPYHDEPENSQLPQLRGSHQVSLV